MDSLLKLIFSIIGTVGLIATVGGCVYAMVNPRIRAVVKVAWKAAFRFRVFWVMAVLLVHVGMYERMHASMYSHVMCVHT